MFLVSLLHNIYWKKKSLNVSTKETKTISILLMGQNRLNFWEIREIHLPETCIDGNNGDALFVAFSALVLEVSTSLAWVQTSIDSSLQTYSFAGAAKAFFPEIDHRCNKIPLR